MTYQEPIGAPNAPQFTYLDLLNTIHEFPQTPSVYFGNHEQTIECIPSVFNPNVQWCAPKATDSMFGSGYYTDWTVAPPYKPPACVAHCGVPEPVPHSVVPEPNHMPSYILLFLAAYLALRKRFQR